MLRVRNTISALLLVFMALSARAAENHLLLIRDGYVMPMTPEGKDLPRGDVLIRNNSIVAVGENLNEPNARIINAKGSFVLPGFVDTHSHLWVTTMRGQFRNGEAKFFPVSNRLAKAMQPDDIYIAMYSGALELMSGGITTTGDFFDNIQGPAWGEAGYKALKNAGIRAILYYGGPDKTTRSSIDLKHLAQLAQQNDGMIKMGLGWRLPRQLQDEKNWAMRDSEYRAARDNHWPVQVHVSGDADAMFSALINRHYLAPFVTVVHATDAQQEQLHALEQAKASLALTPVSEHRVGYGLTRLDHFSSVSRQGLGIDGNSLAGSGDMFATLRLAALTLSGATRNESLPQPRQLLELATRRGAETLGLDKETGSLEAGKRADIQIITPEALNMSGFGGGDPAALLLYSAKPQNVSTVIINGQIVKLEGEMQNVDLAKIMADAKASAEGLLQRTQTD